MSTDVAAILLTSAFQTMMQATAIFMLYQQGRILSDVHKMVLSADQLAAAGSHLDSLVKEIRELLPQTTRPN